MVIVIKKIEKNKININNINKNIDYNNINKIRIVYITITKKILKKQNKIK